MQAVDILCDDRDHLPCGLELHDRVVNRVRLGTGMNLPRLQLVVPVFDARRLRCEELLVEHRTPSFPHAVRPAKIGNAAGRRHTGAGEYEDAPRGPKVMNEVRTDRVIECHRDCPNTLYSVVRTWSDLAGSRLLCGFREFCVDRRGAS